MPLIGFRLPPWAMPTPATAGTKMIAAAAASNNERVLINGCNTGRAG